MSRGEVWLRAGCSLAAVLGGYLLVSGALRLLGGAAAVGGPVARLLVGLLLVLAAAGVFAVGRRGRGAVGPTGSRRRPGPTAAPGVEAVTCPRCGETNAPSAQHCHTCERPLR